MQNHARVRRSVLGLLLVAMAVVGVVRRPAAQGQFVNITIHMVAEPGLTGRVALIPSTGLCDVNDQNGVLQPNGDRTSQCSFQIASGTILRLTANVPGGSGMPGVFSNPAGSATCGPFSTCEFPITQNSDVTATFSNSTPTYTMTVNLAGDPGEVGTDNSRCQNYDFHPSDLPMQGSECVTRYAQGSTVTTEAWPPVATRFITFSQGTHDAGVCGTTARCSFALTADTSVTATFSALTAVAVDPLSQTIGIGESQGFAARGTYADNTTEPIAPFHMGTWISKTDMKHYRYSFGAVAVGNRIYAMGGSSTSGPLASVEAYDPSTNNGRGSWTDTDSSMPMPLAGFGVGTSDGRFIYAAGGATTNACPVDTLLRYDTASDVWETKTAMPGGPRRFLTSAVVGRRLYAIGGELNPCFATSGTVVGTVEAYDLDTETWTTKASLPTARRFLASGVVNGIIYVVGGDNLGGALATVDAYDPATDTWSTRAPLPQARTLLAVGTIDGVLFAVGGLGDGQFSTSLFAYDAATDSWSQKSPIPEVRGAWLGTDGFAFGGERAEHAVASLGGRLYLLGGFGGTSGIQQNVPIVLSFTENLIWSTGDPAVASIDQNFQNGLARGLTVGATDVIARSGTITCAAATCGALTVTNGPPGVNLGSPNPRTISEGQSTSVSGSFSDLAADGPWTATVDFGDGSGTQPFGSFTSPGSYTTPFHQYADNGTFDAIVSVRDHNGVTGTGTLQVNVTNVAPQVFLPFSTSTNVNSSSTFACATFNDPGSHDGPWTAVVDYGDGTGPQTAAPGSCGGGGTPTGSFPLSHAYSHGGTFTVGVTVTDKDGGAGPRSMQVTVTLAQIFMSTPNSATTQVNSTSNFGCGSFSDANGGSWTATVSYGDGSGTQELPLVVPPSGPCAFQGGGGNPPTGVFAFNHAYTSAGSFPVTVTILNTVTHGTRTSGFTVSVTDNHCATVTLTIAGSVPFPQLPVTVTQSSNGQSQSFDTAVNVGTNTLDFQNDEQGSYHVVFHPPAGYTAAPDHFDFTVVCGTNLAFTVVVSAADTTPPVLTVPGNVSTEASGPLGAVVTFVAPTAADNGSGVQSVGVDHASGTTFPLGTTTVHVVATDNAGNTAAGSFTVTVRDTTAPFAACTPVPGRLERGDDDDDHDELGKGLFRVTGSDAVGPLRLKIGVYALTSGDLIQLSVKHKGGVVEISHARKSGIRRFLVGVSDAFIVAKDGAGNSTMASCPVATHGDHDHDRDDRDGKDNKKEGNKDGRGDR